MRGMSVKITVVAVSAIALAGVGAFAGMAVGAVVPPQAAPAGVQAADGTKTTPIPKPTYSLNASGQSYGSVAWVSSDADAPDLVSVQATNGKNGYAYETDLAKAEGSGFTSPEQALAWQAANLGKTQAVPVYDVEGKTVIGEFDITVTPGQAH